MIARLQGTLLEKKPGSVILDVGGVGYLVAIPVSTFAEMGEPGARIDLHIHTHVREDAIALYGFHSRSEKTIFSRLIGVSGVGPRTALAVLSGLGAEDLIEAVRDRDVARLASVPGIGRKTAERMVVDLADRVESLRSTEEDAAPSERAAGPAGMRQDLVSALVNLGYNPRAAADAAGRAIKAADGAPAAPFQVLLRQSLRMLSR